MKKLYFLGLWAILLNSSSILAQVADSGLFDPPVYQHSFDKGHSFNSMLANSHFGINTGVSYTAFNRNSGIFSKQISPYWQKNLGNKFTIEVGTVFISRQFNNINRLFPETKMPTSFTQNSTLFYANGYYSLNNRTVIYGSVVKSVGIENNVKMNPYALNFNSTTVGIDFKINDYMRVGASVHINNGNYPSIYSPYHQSGFMNDANNIYW
jgi:hypothetical protein